MSTVTIRGVDEKTYRKIKAIAALRGVKVGDIVNEALKLWLSIRPEVLEAFSTIDEEADRNRKAYESLRSELEKYKGKYVAIAHGSLLGVYDSIKEAAEAVERANARHGIVKKIVEEAPEKVELGWSLVEL
ncbi:hypothetical protein IG193_01630 [Infirmifilum lucidum]|uniref:DUF5678 domain-containing protein n=1 Tax=Infirmifilum lucidum TaxID=2776706 RepID=A0A7L9FH88_9CREN|nr:hypothetical protein [Infirmifilum lucidum]QOJ79188.1 hypothetical protein IG193_01630 [Infirmifilum lucidum]